LVVTIIVSPKAVDDLEEIGDYIARVNRPVR
jgi:plasmid stabilization system protein ParE